MFLVPRSIARRTRFAPLWQLSPRRFNATNHPVLGSDGRPYLKANGSPAVDGGSGCECCESFYKQARECGTDALRDVWFTEADAATLTTPFSINLDENCYYFGGDDPSETPGTIYDLDDVIDEYADCEECYCAQDFCFRIGNPLTCDDCTPEFVLLRLAGWSTCDICRVSGGNSFKFVGSPDGDYCLPYSAGIYQVISGSAAGSGSPVSRNFYSGNTTCSGSPTTTDNWGAFVALGASFQAAFSTANGQNVFDTSLTDTGPGSNPFPDCMTPISWTPSQIAPNNVYCTGGAGDNREFQGGSVTVIPCGCSEAGI